jgi:hypothetical protein
VTLAYEFDPSIKTAAQKISVSDSAETTITLTERWYLIYATGANVHFVLYTDGETQAVTDFTAGATAASPVFYNGHVILLRTGDFDKMDVLCDNGDSATLFLSPAVRPLIGRR